MKKALVCGAGGFIASHLVKRLKRQGYWVRGVDLKRPEFAATAADDFHLLDLREKHPNDPEGFRKAAAAFRDQHVSTANSTAGAALD